MEEAFARLAVLAELLSVLTIARASHAQRAPDSAKPADTARGWTPPRLVVSELEVTLDGRRVADTQKLAEGELTERIEPTIQELEARARERKDPARLEPPSAALEALDSTPFRVVRKLLFSIAQAHYGPVIFVDRDVTSRDNRDCAHAEKRHVLLLHSDGYVLYLDGTTPVALVNSGEHDDDAALRTALSKRKRRGRQDDCLQLATDDDVSLPSPHE
jgi:hypothetical protein